MNLRAYSLVTIAYWGFTLTDGALRMLVLLHFYERGLNAIQLAFLFLLYEVFGILTNLFGGWLAAHRGLKITLTAGLFLQITSLILLSLTNPSWSLPLAISYIMATQALSGIAKDLTKMSSKSAIRVLIPQDSNQAQGRLFQWVAILTGSKNALKGLGFFLGGSLLATIGFHWALWTMALALTAILAVSQFGIKETLGKSKQKIPFRQLFSKSREINLLSAARFFLFASRDAWFVVGLPLYLSSTLDWSHAGVGSFMALWVIGYGFIQATAPKLLRQKSAAIAQSANATLFAGLALLLVSLFLALALKINLPPTSTIIAGLTLFGFVFALNSSLHSYLILAYSDADQATLNVGFYYMANAGGRLLGTLLSGLTYQWAGLEACLWVSSACVFLALVFTYFLPRTPRNTNILLDPCASSIP